MDESESDRKLPPSGQPGREQGDARGKRSALSAPESRRRARRQDALLSGGPAPPGLLPDLDDDDFGVDNQAPDHHLKGLGPAARLRRRFSLAATGGCAAAHAAPERLDQRRPPRRSPAIRPKAIRTAREARQAGLIEVSTPIDVDRLEELLAGHPNGPLVNTVIHGLRNGFWPCHSSEPTPEPSGRTKEDAYRLSPEHRAIIKKQVDEEVEPGWISAGFALIPDHWEIVVSPRILVEREGSKARVVDNHSTLLLNNGIRKEDAPTVYDMVENLLQALRFLKERHPELLKLAELYKLDVRSAFKLLPRSVTPSCSSLPSSTNLMSDRPSSCFPCTPFWQIRQGIFIVRSDGILSFHLQRRGAFGCRSMPHLWTTFMGTLSWLVNDQLGIELPFAYMDDVYGIDVSGETCEITVGGEERRLPRNQAAISALWTKLRILHSSKKAEFGRELVITGFLVQLDQWEVSISDKSKTALILQIDRFLRPAVPMMQPVVEWQRTLGYMNWALNVMPFAWPLLTPLYEKLRAGNGRPRYWSSTRIAINLAVRHAALLFMDHINQHSRLALNDPGLTEWTTADAYLVVYSDACLVAEAPHSSSSGLGFWLYLNGARRHYFCRPLVQYAKIQFAETLAVCMAIKEGVRAADAAGRPLHCILACTDLAAAVFAFDTGAGADTKALPLHSLILRTFSFLRSQPTPIDLLVRHIAGVRNDLSDKLSRLSPRYLERTYPSIARVAIPAWLPSSAGLLARLRPLPRSGTSAGGP